VQRPRERGSFERATRWGGATRGPAAPGPDVARRREPVRRAL
jgi:hypothetical protein